MLVIQSKKTDNHTKVNNIEKKIADHGHSNNCITAPEFNKLTAENFSTRLKEKNLASKSDIANLVNQAEFDNKLLNFNKRINSNKKNMYLLKMT